ncbi:MAG: protein YgfX [Methylococcales bacterium]|nr:protein YgfX [Methylococcales bacterium]
MSWPLRTSKGLQRLWLAMMALAIAAISCAGDLTPALKISASMGLLFAAIVEWRRMQDQTRWLLYHPETEHWILADSEQQQLITVLAETFVSPWFSVLAYRCHQHRRYFAITIDSLPPGEYRKLIKTLRVNGVRQCDE